MKRIYASERIDVIFGQSLRILVVHPHAARTPRPHLALHDSPLASHLLAFVPARPRSATDSPPAPSPEQIGLRHPHRHHRIFPSTARTATLFSTRNAARTPFVFFSTACPNTHTRARAHTSRQSPTHPSARRPPSTARFAPYTSTARVRRLHPRASVVSITRIIVDASIPSRTLTATRAPLTDALKLNDALMVATGE